MRRAVSEVGNQRMRAIESMQASWANLKDTPKKFGLKLAHSLAEGRRNRAQNRYDAVSDLPEGSYLKKRRFAKLQKTEFKLRDREEALNNHTQRMESRREAVNENYDQRRQETINELAERRKQAQARKTLRRELHNQGASRSEILEILEEIPDEHKSRIGKLTIENARQQKAAAKSERAVKKSISQENSISDAISQAKLDAENATQRIKDSQESLKNLQSELPNAQRRVDELAEQADRINQEDPNYNDIMTELKEAQDALNEQSAQISRLTLEIANDRQLYLTSKHNRQLLEGQLEIQREATQRYKAEAEVNRQYADAKAEELRNASRDTINNNFDNN